MPRWRLDIGASRRTDLDGLRGLAIALVLVEHTGVDRVTLGQVLPFTPAMAGVTVFFTLSGYLITKGLLTEDWIRLRSFYARRAVRLGPALLVVVAFTVVLESTGLLARPWQPGVIGTLLYVSNWLHIAGVDLGGLGHTWSLAIEEQFYIAWPLILIVWPRRYLLPLAAAGAVAGCAMYWLGIGPVYHSTFTNGGALLAGCAMAIWGRTLPRWANSLGIALILVSALVWWQGMAVAGACLVVATTGSALLPLAAVGRRAYSIYLWSWPLVMIVGGPAALLPTLLVAELSYRLIERPIMARFRSAPGSPAPPVDVPREERRPRTPIDRVDLLGPLRRYGRTAQAPRVGDPV
jgi:peptidoglycan/LPS O-acetylase OafA/YrhL